MVSFCLGNFFCYNGGKETTMIKAIIIAEDEFSGLLEFPNAEAMNWYSKGLSKGADLYGAGGCGLYTVDDYEEADDEIKEIIREHLMKKSND
jgi:hypothetical protein